MLLMLILSLMLLKTVIEQFGLNKLVAEKKKIYSSFWRFELIDIM